MESRATLAIVAGVRKMPSAMDSPTTIAIAAGRPNCRRSSEPGEGMADIYQQKNTAREKSQPQLVEKSLHRRMDDACWMPLYDSRRSSFPLPTYDHRIRSTFQLRPVTPVFLGGSFDAQTRTHALPVPDLLRRVGGTDSHFNSLRDREGLARRRQYKEPSGGYERYARNNARGQDEFRGLLFDPLSASRRV
jgi:hypothetical protein